MTLLTLRGVTLSFGGPPLLEGVDLQIKRGERLCLLGRNGSGKSTLLKLIAGEIAPEGGALTLAPGTRVARLAQEVPADAAGSVFEVTAAALGEVSRLLARFHRLSHQVASDAGRLAELERVQHELEAAGGWALNQRVESVLSRMGLDPELPFSGLSGGLKRRVLLARALVTEPDLLLLDEPTNHLDIDGIRWLEEFLLGFGGTLLFITHDRMFLRRLATRILDLDRGRLTSWPGDYDTYLARKEAALEAEAVQQALFDKRLAQEEAWIRQGIKARRTRNEGRVRALKALREERRVRRERTGAARMVLQEAERSGRLVAEARGVCFAYDGTPVVRDLNTTILSGDRVGIIGPNGAGKTTLLRLLLGELKPQQGDIRLGTRLEVAYFDQLRAQLDEERTVRDNVAEGSDQITVNGRNKHIIGYLQDFLFTPERANSPVKVLSGGERNRLLLARLFTRPSNVLVLDEPTNDLDMETLDLLGELLAEYSGTVLLVSHDRAFLNDVVTSTLVFEGDGRVAEYVGGYDDWLRQRPVQERPAAEKAAPRRAEPRPEAKRPAKLGYKDQRELEALPGRIEGLERELEQLQAAMAEADFFRQPQEAISAANARLETLGAELEQAYARWEALESGAGG